MDYAVLRAELLTDPLPLGYGALDDQAAADKVNALDTGRTRARARVPVQEFFNAIDNGAWPVVASASESKLRALLQMAVIDASNTNTRSIIGAIFPNAGATANTQARLLALAAETISRATELGLERVAAADVNHARAGVW